MKKVVGILDATMKGGLVLTTTVMIVTCTLQVLSRYVLDHPFSWTEEVARFSFIWWSFLGAAYVVRLNGHLGMDILVKVLPRKWRTVAQKLVFAITLGFASLVTYQGVKITYLQAGQEADLVPISMACIYSVVPFTGIIMVIYLVYLLFFWKDPELDNAGSGLPDKEKT